MEITIKDEFRVLNIECVNSGMTLIGEVRINKDGVLTTSFGQITIDGQYDGNFNKTKDNISVNVKDDKNIILASDMVSDMLDEVVLR